MSWSLSGQITKDQDAEQRLEDITHEYIERLPETASDVTAAKEAAARIIQEVDAGNMTINVTLSGHRDDRNTHIVAHVSATRELNGS